MARRGARPTVRLLAAFIAMIVAFGAVVVQLVRLQIVDAATLEARGARQRIRTIVLPAKRGTIYDRNMIPLAMSVPARSIYADPRDVVDAVATAGTLAAALGIEEKSLLARLKRDSSFVYVARGVEVPLADRVMSLALPGIGELEETKRVYPQGSLAAQVLGFVGVDGNGLAGIESSEDSILSGKAGRQVTEVDPAGHAIPHGRSLISAPKPGGDVVLTIDRTLQFEAEDALDRALSRTGARRGSALVLDPKTGEVLAMANRPAFDPELMEHTTGESTRNRAVQDVYEPGSVNKLITAAAALESGVASPSDMLTVPDTIQVGGQPFSDFAPHPVERWTYAEGLAHSSNVATIQIAQRVGPNRLYSMLRKFGLGSGTGIGFPGESAGLLDPPSKWSDTSMATIPVGQGIAVTPLQMASVYATVADGGLYTQPVLVKKTGKPVRPATRRVISGFTSAQLRAMLMGVVETGTGKPARIPGYLVGGKTGTARIPLVGARGYSGQVMTTFIGMVPVDAPRLVAAVVMEAPAAHFASATAAPAWREIIQFALGYYRIPPSYEIDPAELERQKRLGTP